MFKTQALVEKWASTPAFLELSRALGRLVRQDIESVLALLRKEAIHVIKLTHLPRPSQEEAEGIADRPSTDFLSEPRWHDFLGPDVREIVLELEKKLHSSQT
jgi:hypothetical protein